MRQSGFTLLELSIALVIIGLIIGGVTVGAELIKQTEMRAVLRQKDEIFTAVQTFKLKHGQLLGDFTKAGAYWPTDCVDQLPDNPCNGDGWIEVRDDAIRGSNRRAEGIRAYHHLSLSC